MNLKIDFNETITVGNNVATKASEFQDLLNKIKAINEELSASWEGTDASKYTGAVAEQSVNMEKLTATMEEIGAFLVKVGNAYKSAMEQNANDIIG